MLLSLKTKNRNSLLIALIALAISIALSQLSWFKNFDADTWDWRVNALANPEKASDEIVVILLDQASLDWINKESEISWPWPREVFSLIVDYCHDSKAKALAFDVLFNEPSRLQGDDKVLATSLEKSKNFVLATNLNHHTGIKKLSADYNALLVDIEGDEAKHVYPNMSAPLNIFLKNAAILAHVNSSPGPDGIHRTLIPIIKFQDTNLPSLGLATYLVANRDQAIKLDKRMLFVGDKKIPLNADGNSLLRFRGKSKTHKTFSAAAILQSAAQIMEGKEPLVKPQELEGKYIFFGYSAPALNDQHNTPMGGQYPGVEVHATFLDNLLQNDFFVEVPISISIAISFFIAILCSLSTVRITNFNIQIPVILLFIALPFLASFLAAYNGFRISFALPMTSVVFSAFLAVGFNYLTEGRQKRFIKYAFNHYLSKDFIDQIISNPELLKLGGSRREISIFFSDLEGFTTISERLEPEILIEVLNDYLSEMSNIILDEKGTIDKYEGDAIIAFWNAPLDVENHAQQIVKSALACQAKLTAMQDRLIEKTGSPLKMRIGVHTGPAVVGNMGAAERFDYTMLGDSVNLAARLEGVNKQFGTYTIISEETRKQIGDIYPVRELARVAVVGRKKPVTIFEPMYKEEYIKRQETLEIFNQGLQLFYKEDLPAAFAIFESIKEQDAASEHYAQKCRLLIDSKECAPNGVWQMTSK